MPEYRKTGVRTPSLTSQSAEHDAARLSEFCRVFASNLVDLILCQLLARCTGWIAGLAEKTVQAGRRHDPEQEQLLIGIGEAMPGVLGNVDRSALLKTVRYIVQREGSAALQHVKGFVHLEVSVDRNACTNRYLLGPHGQIAGSFDGIDLDEDVAGIAEMNEVFAPIGAQHVALWRRSLGSDRPLQQRVA